MQHLKFSSDSEIILEATNKTGTTPEEVIHEAIQFVKEHNLESVDLRYGEFLMAIEPDTSLNELISEYINWRKLQVSVCTCEMPAKVPGKNER